MPVLLRARPFCPPPHYSASMHRRSLPLLALLPAFAALAACASRGNQSAASGLAPSPTGGFDVVIENGRIIDGTGAAWFYGDVGVVGDRIARIAPRAACAPPAPNSESTRSGQVVAPGFIDIQSGSYGNFLGNGDGRPSARSRKASPPRSWAKAARPRRSTRRRARAAALR